MHDHTDPNATLLEFPCRFPVKVFGINDGDFQHTVHELIKPHVPDLTTADISHNTSSSGKYMSVTVTIIARDKAQIDAIYADLTDSDAVAMAL